MLRTLPAFGFRLPSLRTHARRWTAVSRQRTALSELDDTMLADIGLTREDARREASRPFWDAPDNWRM